MPIKKKLIIIVKSCLFIGIFNIIAYNGKSIGEVRAFEERKVQESSDVADIFSMKRTYKKLVEWKNSGGESSRIFQFSTSPRILPIQC